MTPKAKSLFVWIKAAMDFLQPNVDHTKLAEADAIYIDSVDPLFEADESKMQTSGITVSIQFRESSFRHGVVSKTNDHCEMQIHDRADVDDDRIKCLDAGFKILRDSFKRCPNAPLAMYVGGGCTNARAKYISHDRFDLAAHLLAEVRPQ